MYGIIYGGAGRNDYYIDGDFRTVDDAREAYNPRDRMAYDDGVLGGAEIVALDRDGSPSETIEEIVSDENLNALILSLGCERASELISQQTNTTADVDTDGNVWVEGCGSGRGLWLKSGDKADFVRWCRELEHLPQPGFESSGRDQGR